MSQTQDSRIAPNHIQSQRHNGEAHIFTEKAYPEHRHIKGKGCKKDKQQYGKHRSSLYARLPFSLC